MTIIIKTVGAVGECEALQMEVACMTLSQQAIAVHVNSLLMTQITYIMQLFIHKYSWYAHYCS